MLLKSKDSDATPFMLMLIMLIIRETCTVLVLSSIENKNNLLETNTGLETPTNFSATNRLDIRKTSNYPARVET